MPQQFARPRGQHNEQSYPYYSHVRFQFTNTVTGSAGVELNSLAYLVGTEVKAFNYAQSQQMLGAGFLTGNATPLDTNLIKQSETVAGETVKIYGLSFLLDSDADAELTRLIFANVSVRLGLNGDQQLYNLGPLSMLPGGGGLHGLGRTYNVAPALSEGLAMSGALQNGLPGAANFFRLPTPVTWAPPGGSDSTLVITCRCERTIALAISNRVAAAGIQAIVAPTTGQLGSYSGGWFVLHSVTRSKRSVNA